MINNNRVTEKILYLDDLKSADNIYISNAIIGFVRVEKVYY